MVRGGTTSRSQLPPRLLWALAAIDMALCQAEHFLKELDIEETDLFGGEGANAAVRALCSLLSFVYGLDA
eukprot:2407687-Lingulodinium_polyedra.AAC.1